MNEWNGILDLLLQKLEKTVPRTVYELWFQDIKLHSINEEEVIFSINNDFKCTILSTRHLDTISRFMEEIMGFRILVRFISTEKDVGVTLPRYTDDPCKTVEEEEDKEEEIKEDIPSMDTPGIVEKYTFDTFIEGESNKFAKAACRAVAKTPFSIYNPLFIYGESGLGKTHLLYAITNEIKRSTPEVKILYKKGEDFTNELVQALQNGTISSFHSKYRSIDVLLIDDIQFIAGKDSTQEAFFHTFNALYENSKQIILTSDRPPREIRPLEDRLKSRFEWGLVADIQPPSIELRTAIIQKKAESLPMKLDKEIVDLLARSPMENVRQIEGIIKKIAAVSVLSATPVTKAMCERIVKEFISGTIPPAMLSNSILHYTSEQFGVPIEEIKGKKRNNGIATARHVAIYLIHEMTDYSLNDIGDIFERDHTTVLNSIQRVKEQREKDESFESAICEIKEKLGL